MSAVLLALALLVPMAPARPILHAQGTGSYVFDGTDDFLHITSAPVTAVPISVGVWFRGADVADRFPAVWWLGQVANMQHRYILTWDTGGFNKRVSAIAQGTGNAGDQVDANSTNAEGSTLVWRSGVGVWAGVADLHAYQDGTDEGTNITSVTVSTPNRMEVGRVGGSTPTGFWEGHIGYVFVWSVALSDAEVADWHAGNIPQSSNLIAAYDLTQSWGAGPITDQTGNGHNLTINGALFTTAQVPPEIYSFGGGGGSAPCRFLLLGAGC